MKITKIILKKWTDYLQRLAAVNSELYGNKRLDCCDLDRKKKIS